MQQVILYVDGMSCHHCIQAIQGAIETLGAKANIELENKKVTISYDESKHSVQELKNVIEEQGYDIM